MNKLQKAYIKAKAAYEAAFKAEKWDLVDQLEDPFLDAEFNLVDWAAEVAINHGGITEADWQDLRRKCSGEQWDKLVDMAVRLQA